MSLCPAVAFKNNHFLLVRLLFAENCIFVLSLCANHPKRRRDERRERKIKREREQRNERDRERNGLDALDAFDDFRIQQYQYKAIFDVFAVLRIIHD